MHTCWHLSNFVFADSDMELEDLYKRYCVRLKHALFTSSLAVAGVSCAITSVFLIFYYFSYVSIHRNPSGVMIGGYQFRFPKQSTLKIILSFLAVAFFATCHMTSMYFPSTLLDAGALHGKYNTVDLEKGWAGRMASAFGHQVLYFHDEAEQVTC